MTPVNAAPRAARPSAAPEDPKLREATRQWEAFFVGHLLKQMRKTTGETDNKDNPFAPSEGEKTFRDMLDDETAQNLSKTRGLGLADLLYDQMRSVTGPAPAAHAAAAAAPPSPNDPQEPRRYDDRR